MASVIILTIEIFKIMDKLIITKECDVIDVTLDPNEHPVAYKRKLKELMNNGLSKQDAVNALLRPIQLELFYDIDTGLFAVEAEAVDCCDIYNPYSGEKIEKV